MVFIVHTAQFRTVHYSTIQYSTVQYSTMKYSTVQYSTVQYSTIQYSTIQYSTLRKWICARMKESHCTEKPSVRHVYHQEFIYLYTCQLRIRANSFTKSKQYSKVTCNNNFVTKARVLIRKGSIVFVHICIYIVQLYISLIRHSLNP